MELYYHKTDGGAEYYGTKHLPTCDELDMFSAIMRTDGNEIEIFTERLKEQGIKLRIN